MASNQTAWVWEGTLEALCDFPIETKRTALLIVDMQYLDAHPDYGMGRRARETGSAQRYAFYFNAVEEMTPRIKKLQSACRRCGVEVVFTVIASHVKDCRDVSLEHKRLNLLAPAGSREAQVLDEIAPLENELVLIKGCSGVFNG